LPVLKKDRSIAIYKCNICSSF